MEGKLIKVKSFKCNDCISKSKNFIQNVRKTKEHNVMTGKEKTCESSQPQFKVVRQYANTDVNQEDIGSSEKHQIFNCSYCSAKFLRKDRLIAHFKIKHNELYINNLPFKCNFCESHFKYLHNLRVHEVRKHNISLNKKFKPFKCTDCTAKFTRKDRLNAHIKQKHAFYEIDLNLESTDYTVLGDEQDNSAYVVVVGNDNNTAETMVECYTEKDILIDQLERLNEDSLEITSSCDGQFTSNSNLQNCKESINVLMNALTSPEEVNELEKMIIETKSRIQC